MPMSSSASRPFSSTIVSAALVRIAAVALVIGVAACASRGRAPIEERSQRPAPPAAAPPEAETVPQTYTVKPGDTLRAIASERGIDYRELAAWNNIENPN